MPPILSDREYPTNRPLEQGTDHRLLTRDRDLIAPRLAPGPDGECSRGWPGVVCRRSLPRGADLSRRDHREPGGGHTSVDALPHLIHNSGHWPEVRLVPRNSGYRAISPATS